MNSIISLVLLAIFLIGINLLATKFSTGYVKNMIDYQYENPQLCLKKLNNPFAKIVIPSYQRTMLKLNSLSSLNDTNALESEFETINAKINKKSSLLAPREKVMLLQKEISFYIYSRKEAKVHEVNAMIQALDNDKLDKFSKQLIEEANICTQIYIDHNFSYLEKAKQTIAQSKNSIVQGIWHYRLAYLYHVKNASKECNDHFNKAYELLKDSDVKASIEPVKSNFELIDTIAI